MSKFKQFIQNQFETDAGANASDLTRFMGVTQLTLKTAPEDYVTRVQSDAFDVKGYYRVDNLARFNKWSQLMTLPKARERWLFFGCPTDMLEAVLTEQRLQLYGDWYGGLFGRNSLYLQDSATEAAHAAFRFNSATTGYLISVRLAIHNTYRATRPITTVPNGHDVIRAPQGTDLGYGPLPCDLFAATDPDMALVRFVTHIQRR